MFQTILQWCGRAPKSPTKEPLLALSESDLSRLRLWWSDDDARGVFIKALDRSVNIHAEALLLARDSTDVHLQQGIIHGLRKAALLVDELVTANESAKRSVAERDFAASVERDSRTAALYGSPAFSRVASR